MTRLSAAKDWRRWVVCLAPLCLVLFVVGPTVRERYSRPTCLNNLRQLGQALALYTSDYDGVWPNEAAWRTRKLSSTPLSGCPLLGNPPGEGIPGYAYNFSMRRSTPGSRIAFPEQTIAVCEAPPHIKFTMAVNPYQDYPEEAIQIDRAWERHAGGAHYLFCDGHVEWLRGEQVMGTDDAELGNTGAMPSFVLSSTTELYERSVREFGRPQ